MGPYRRPGVTASTSRCTRVGSTGLLTMPSRLIDVPTISASAIDSSSAAVAGVDVDADEARADGARDRERGARVALQHVDPDGRGRQLAPDLPGDDGHGGDGGGLDAAGGERHVAVVLDDERVHPVLDERTRV